MPRPRQTHILTVLHSLFASSTALNAPTTSIWKTLLMLRSTCRRAHYLFSPLLVKYRFFQRTYLVNKQAMIQLHYVDLVKRYLQRSRCGFCRELHFSKETFTGIVASVYQHPSVELIAALPNDLAINWWDFYSPRQLTQIRSTSDVETEVYRGLSSAEIRRVTLHE